MFLKSILRFFIPGSLVFAASIIFLKTESLNTLWPLITSIYPYSVFIIGLLLGWRFSRSRLIFILIVLAIADRAILLLNFEQAETLDFNLLIFNIITFFVPINIMVIALLRERGVFTLRGFGRIIFILAQPFLIYAVFHYKFEYAFNFLNYTIIESQFLTGNQLTQPVLIIYLLAFVVTILNFIMKQDVVEGSFFWGLLCSFFAFLSPGNQPLTTLYLSSAGLVLITSVLEYSHNVAFRDELTGLPTRRSLNEAFLKLPSRYSIAMVDVDHFKKINDRHGHDVGDQVLRMIATQLLKVSGGGKAYRYGGEEFVIIFSGKEVVGTKSHAEDLRQIIDAKQFHIRSSKRPRKKPQELKSAQKSRKIISVSVSIGIAERDGNHDTPLEVLKAADKALLRAKKAGRNRVRIFGKLNLKG